ncbi:MAG TPA: hypothetical protein VHJ20_03290 [Polyangia bacterium]|nr:hypothetical protein [Polyangia bacterium]
MARPAYPPDLAHYVRTRWPSGHALTVSEDLLCEALAVAYQASLTAEESRPTRFRLLLTPPEALPESGRPNEGVLRLRFAEDRPFTIDELRSLGPAAPFDASLIGAHAVDARLRIWGLAHSGPAWLAPTWGGRGLVPNWTYDPIIHVNGPGRLAVRCAGKLVGGLERGVLVDATIDVFDSEWLPGLFAHERQVVQEEHAAGQAGSQSPTAAADPLVGRVGQHMLRRAIQLVRGARHGGLLLIVDAAAGLDNVFLKYRFDNSEPPRRYRTLLFRILDRLAAGTDRPLVDWADYARATNPELEKLEQAVFEMSRVMASLTSIDGAVVLDKRFAILGFGAEVSGELPSPLRVWRASDLEGRVREPAALDDVGTRHRAAYRFVHRHPRGLAIVISQDGGVSFVANHGDEVVFWEQSFGP